MRVFLTIITVFIATTVFGQEQCNIYYDYDNGGNRIKREYKCEDPNLEEQLSPGFSVRPRLYPNPTTGTFHVSFDENVVEVKMLISDAVGRVMVNKTFSDVYEVTHDISSYNPQSYILDLTIKRANNQIFTASFTLIKMDE